MPRRIELELTSERPDGTWTWRAAGAREPKGELDGGILPPGCSVGDVLRAEADFHIEGITVLSVLPPKGPRREPERLEIIGPQREFTPVTSTLVGKSDRSRGPRRDRGDRPDRPDRPSRPRRDEHPVGARRDDRPGGPRTPRPEGPRSERPRRERPAPPPPKPKPKKLRPGHAHRDALLAGLSPEQQPIAEQLFRGGMPSVRTALEEQNAKAKAEGTPEIPATTVLSIAEDLVGRVRVADWLDRAEAAAADADEIALRDLRAVVASADDVARDESTRELASRLKEVLERRTAAEQAEWLQDLTASLEGGRVVRALRLSARPPQPGEVLPAELQTKLTEAANAAMTADIAPDRWATLLDAVAYSPVRKAVVPVGAPAEPGEELLAMVRKHAGRVPNAATLFGIEPPPAGKRPSRTPRPKPTPEKVSHPPLPPLPGGGRRIPPPPRPTGVPTSAPAADVPAAAAPDSPQPHGDVLPVEAPAAEAAPAVDPAPAVEVEPAVDVEPAADAAPAIESAPAVDPAPAVEAASPADAAPAPHATASAEPPPGAAGAPGASAPDMPSAPAPSEAAGDQPEPGPAPDEAADARPPEAPGQPQLSAEG